MCLTLRSASFVCRLHTIRTLECVWLRRRTYYSEQSARSGAVHAGTLVTVLSPASYRMRREYARPATVTWMLRIHAARRYSLYRRTATGGRRYRDVVSPSDAEGTRIHSRYSYIIYVKRLSALVTALALVRFASSVTSLAGPSPVALASRLGTATFPRSCNPVTARLPSRSPIQHVLVCAIPAHLRW